MKNFKSIAELIIPCIILGIGIALFIGLFIMLSYVFVWGLLIGVIIWIGITIKKYFFSPEQNKKAGRIIEHKDKD